MRKYTVFIDESGTLPDIKDRVIIVAAVGTNTPEAVERIFGDLQKKRGLKKGTSELKFYTAGEKTKLLFFEKIAKENIDIFILTVEKMGRKIPDTPQHFAVLCWLLLTDVISFYPEITEIVFDRHFSRKHDLDKFNKTLTDFFPAVPKISHVDSKMDKKVNIADMTAGAVLASETGKDTRFYEMIKEMIISTKRLNWAEAKRRFLDNKKLA